jgi:hypothetical protein
MPRHSSTFIYLALALGLVCYFSFVEKKLPGTKEEEESDKQLFTFNQEDVTGLEVTNVHGVFIFTKDNGHWEIKSPVNTPADGSVVDEVISAIAYAQPQRTIRIDGDDRATPDTLKEWGLAPAAERVVIHTKDKKYELYVGRKMAINDSVYARASGRKNEPVRILPNSVKAVLQKDLSDFRSRNVFDFDADKVTRVATRIAQTPPAPAEECEVDLKDGKWTLQKPLVARASAPDVQALLQKILALRVTDFVTDDASNLSQYGLNAPMETLSLGIQPDQDMTLQIGAPVPNKAGQVYAQRLKSNSVFTLLKSSVDELVKELPDMRDRHVLPFEAGAATGLTFSFGAKSGSVRRENGTWSTVGPMAGRADVGKVNDALSRLSQLETTPTLKDSATDLKPFGLDKPAGKVAVQTGDKAGTTLTLLIGKDENKLLYVRNSIEPFIYTVPENAFDFLPANNMALLDARAIDLPVSQVHGMTITAPPEPSVALTRSAGGTWTAANVKDRMVDSVKADTQAALFCQLQAKAWLGAAKPSDGLDKPVLTIALQTDQPKATVLRIGAALPDGGRAAEVEGNPNVFELAEGDFGILNSSSLEPIPAAAGGAPAPAAPAPAAPATNAAPAK